MCSTFLVMENLKTYSGKYREKKKKNWKMSKKSKIYQLKVANPLKFPQHHFHFDCAALKSVCGSKRKANKQISFPITSILIASERLTKIHYTSSLNTTRVELGITKCSSTKEKEGFTYPFMKRTDP